MKKQILTLAAICAAACCLGACNQSGNNSSSNEYDNLNAMLKADYSQVVLTVTNTYGENTSLKSEYIIDYSENDITVNYSVEKFTKIDANLDNPLTALITTDKGTVVIYDGVVVPIVGGNDINFTADIAKIGINFKEEYFENSVLSGVLFKADVKNDSAYASAFLGSQLNCTDMKVSATFDEVFNYIRITYKSAGGNDVEYKYIFTI